MNRCLVMTNGRYRYAGSEYMKFTIDSRCSSTNSLKRRSSRKSRRGSSTSLKSNKSNRSLRVRTNKKVIEKAGGRIFSKGVVSPLHLTKKFTGTTRCSMRSSSVRSNRTRPNTMNMNRSTYKRGRNRLNISRTLDQLHGTEKFNSGDSKEILRQTSKTSMAGRRR